MRIGEVAARSGVSVRSLRYYEERQLLNSTRSSSGQRHYGDGAIERVRLIQLLYAAGLSSTTIQELLPCVDSGVSTEHSQALLLSERAKIDRQIADLAEARSKLDEIIQSAADSAQPCVHATAETTKVA
jgi:DNA-binding transcriptional MerR regulator